MVLFQQNLIFFYVGVFFTLFVGVFYLLTFFENRSKFKDPRAKTYPAVSVIVPAYNEEKTLAKTVSSLLRMDYPKDKIEVIVVDDGSKDRTYEIAKGFSDKRVRVFKKENGGKGSAINLGIGKARGEFVAVLDADSFVSRQALKRMVGYFEKKSVMAVTPTLKVYKPRGFWQQVQSIEYLFSVFFRKIFSFMQGVYVTPGPLSVYRKSFFRKHGGFDEKNITEDLEVALRIQSKNYEIQNSINAYVYTVAPNTFGGLMKQRVRWVTGLTDNLYDYRGLFGRDYGSLGIFVLPIAVISILLVLTHLAYYGILGGLNALNSLYNLYLVNFDFATIIKEYFSGFSLWSLLNPLMVLFAVLIASSTFILYLAKKYSGDKGEVRLNFVMYLLTYGIIFSLWWVTTLAHKVFHLKVKW